MSSPTRTPIRVSFLVTFTLDLINEHVRLAFLAHTVQHLTQFHVLDSRPFTTHQEILGELVCQSTCPFTILNLLVSSTHVSPSLVQPQFQITYNNHVEEQRSQHRSLGIPRLTASALRQPSIYCQSRLPVLGSARAILSIP